VTKYFFNFWIWWYIVKAYDVARELFGRWSFVLNYLNIPAMATNLFVPLYQDNSVVGKFISFLIRSVWIIIGGSITLVFAVPLIAIYFVYLLLPIMPIFAVLGTFIKWA
jgi:hypothetical protein